MHVSLHTMIFCAQDNGDDSLLTASEEVKEKIIYLFINSRSSSVHVKSFWTLIRLMNERRLNWSRFKLECWLPKLLESILSLVTDFAFQFPQRQREAINAFYVSVWLLLSACRNDFSARAKARREIALRWFYSELMSIREHFFAFEEFLVSSSES